MMKILFLLLLLLHLLLLLQSHYFDLDHYLLD